ncbi:MAG: epoxyqueuosine reductase QueH [Oscillospiraceae bacterium]|nr:epoxyqueuosine reductase QueH [Oscillospiraceae bacterium]
MNRRNYQRELDRIIERNGDTRPKVLLHVCCGPCSSAVLEYLTQYFDLTILWYNPNIYPEAEFDLRLETLKKLIGDMGLADRVKLLTQPHRSDEYYARVKGLEDEPEGGKRCTECFRLRLEEAAKAAKAGGFDYFCTTLTLSRHKDAVRINTLAEEIAQRKGVKWLPSDFKKRDGENRSIELCELYHVYRQLYCGCEYSFRKREDHGA